MNKNLRKYFDIKASDWIIHILEENKIDTVFTVSGGGCMHLIDSLGSTKNIKFICNHHEQACAIAAEAYWRTSGKIGCIVVTTGPGGTNALTGVLCAYQDSIPMLIISGQVPTQQMSAGTGCRQIGQQEFDIVNTVKTMTKYSTTITDKNKVTYEFDKAINIATSGRPGPVWIDVPLDIQAAMIDISKQKKYKKKSTNKKLSDFINVSKLQTLLNECEKPIIVIGNGIKSSGTEQQLYKFLSDTRLPIVSGIHTAVDVITSEYEHYAGRIGIFGRKQSNSIIQSADLVISLGSRLNPKITGYDSMKFAPNAIKVIIDVDKNELKKLKFNKSLKWCIDLKMFFKMTENIKVKKYTPWKDDIKHELEKELLVYPKHYNLKDYVSTYVFSKVLETKLGYDSVIVTSNGTAHIVPLKTINLKNRQRLFSNEGTAPMGYGLPAAIGAYYGSISDSIKRYGCAPSNIICIEGDGSIMMNLQELQTVVYHNLPIKIFILNNEGYLSIRQTQNSFFKGREVASSVLSGVSLPSFKKIATAFCIKYYSIKNNSKIESVLDKVFESPEHSIIEVFTDPNEMHEPRVVAKGTTSGGKIIPGELTDMRIVQ